MNKKLSILILIIALGFFMGLALFFAPNHAYSLQAISTASGLIDINIVFLNLAAAAGASWFICYLVIRYEHLHAHLSHDHANAGPQKFHTEPTPRIGGLGIFGGLLLSTWIVPIIAPATSLFDKNFGFLFLAACPAFFGGIVEDISKSVGVIERLLLTMISAAIGAWLLGAVIQRLDFVVLDKLMFWLPCAIIFTVFAVGGVANAVNIIDGYNGLAAGFSIVILTAMAFVATQVNDMLVFMLCVGMIGALLGFLAWNWPKGKIFMGDGGAYLLGFILAELSVLLICRNPKVSPWFPLLLLGYPVFETLFSMFRRKFLHLTVSGHPDALHLHQLLFKWLARHHIRGDHQYITTSNNSRVAPIIWLAAVIVAIFAVSFWQNTLILQLAFFFGCVVYILLYWKLSTIRLHDKRAMQRLKVITASFHEKQTH